MSLKDKLLQNLVIYWHCTLLHRQETAEIKKVVLQSRILPFCSPEPLVANSVQPQSYLQHYSTSVESKEERQTDATRMGPEGQRYKLLLEFLSASHHNIIVYIFQYIPGGKAAKAVDYREDHFIRC